MHFHNFIPKFSSPIKVKDYRPIVCFSTLYKLVAEILTNKMQKVINGLIEMSQSAFVKGGSSLIIYCWVMSNLKATQENGYHLGVY